MKAGCCVVGMLVTGVLGVFIWPLWIFTAVFLLALLIGGGRA